MNSIPIPENFIWDTSFEKLGTEKNKLCIISRMYCF